MVLRPGSADAIFRARAEMRLYSQATFLTVVIDLLTYLCHVFYFIISTEYTYVDNSFFTQLKCLFRTTIRYRKYILFYFGSLNRKFVNQKVKNL